MPDVTERLYYRARANAARSLEQRARDPAVAAIHREMAIRYEALAAEPLARPRLKLVDG